MGVANVPPKGRSTIPGLALLAWRTLGTIPDASPRYQTGLLSRSHGMTELEILDAVGSLGFPIVVAGYLLVRMEKKITALTDAIKDWAVELRKQNNRS